MREVLWHMSSKALKKTVKESRVSCLEYLERGKEKEKGGRREEEKKRRREEEKKEKKRKEKKRKKGRRN